jgi:hypothetical protein
MAKKIIPVVIAFILWSFHPAFAEESTELKVIRSYLESSYITGLGGINFGGKLKWDDLLFEAEIDQHLHWMDNPDWLVNKGLNGTLLVNPKVQLRMEGGESAPVKTPSFKPRITYFFWRNRDFVSEREFRYYSVMLSHYSNGQSGNFYRPDGTVNTDSGNFSTNFFEFAGYDISQIRYLPEWKKVSVTWHPGFNREDNLDDQYETLKVELSAMTQRRILSLGSPGTDPDEAWNYKVYGYVSYIVRGRDYVVAPNPGFPQIVPQKARWYDNVQVSSEIHIKPPGFHAMSIYLRYDYGYDYYNIHFQERINRIQIGFSGAR